MPRMRQKADLPTKVCPVCGRPFTWRKRWARTWDTVIYCSDACRRRKASSLSEAGLTTVKERSGR